MLVDLNTNELYYIDADVCSNHFRIKNAKTSTVLMDLMPGDVSIIYMALATNSSASRVVKSLVGFKMFVFYHDLRFNLVMESLDRIIMFSPTDGKKLETVLGKWIDTVASVRGLVDTFNKDSRDIDSFFDIAYRVMVSVDADVTFYFDDQKLVFSKKTILNLVNLFKKGLTLTSKSGPCGMALIDESVGLYVEDVGFKLRFVINNHCFEYMVDEENIEELIRYLEDQNVD